MSEINKLIFDMRKDYKKCIDFYKKLIEIDVYTLLTTKNIAPLVINEKNATTIDFKNEVDLFAFKTKEGFVVPVFTSLEDLKKAKTNNQYAKINFLQFVLTKETFNIVLNPHSNTETFLPRPLLNDLVAGKFFELNVFTQSLSNMLNELVIKEMEEKAMKKETIETKQVKEDFLRALKKSEVFVFLKNDGVNNHMLTLMDKDNPIVPCFLTLEDVLKSNIEEQFIPFPFSKLISSISSNHSKSEYKVVINPFSENKKVLEIEDVEFIKNNK